MNKKLKGRIVEHYGSQFEFARAIGEHESAVSLVVRGKRQLTDRQLTTWQKALGPDFLKLLEA